MLYYSHNLDFIFYCDTMRILRTLFTIILVVLATFSINYSSLAATTYTPEQVQKIEQKLPQLQELETRLDKLNTLINNKKWVTVKTYIHGPLGDLRRTLTYVSRDFSTQDQAKGKELAKGLFGHLVNIDKAADSGNFAKATSQYQEAIKDFDAFLSLVP
jgi:photosystem II protein PsbQ